eukprot:8952140-Pyramimonas_sp.AAC.1
MSCAVHRQVNDERANAPSFSHIHFRVPRERTQLTGQVHVDEFILGFGRQRGSTALLRARSSRREFAPPSEH